MTQPTCCALLPLDTAEVAVIQMALSVLDQHLIKELPAIASDSEWISGLEALQLRLTGVAQQLPALDQLEVAL